MRASEYFDRRASKYDADLMHPVISASVINEQEFLRKLVLANFSHKDTVLEIGAGTGRYTIFLSKLCREVTAIDPSGRMLDVLKKNIVHHRISNVKIIHSDLEKLKSFKVDHILCAGVLGYVENPAAFINKTAEHCRKKMIITAPNRTFAGSMRKAYYSMRGVRANLFTKKELSGLLYSAGFKNVKISELGTYSFINRLELVAVTEKDK